MNVVLPVYVKPGKEKFSIKIKDNKILITTKNKAVQGKANREIISELRKMIKKDVTINGTRSKKKFIIVHNADKEEVNRLLSMSEKEIH